MGHKSNDKEAAGEVRENVNDFKRFIITLSAFHSLVNGNPLQPNPLQRAAGCASYFGCWISEGGSRILETGGPHTVVGGAALEWKGQRADDEDDAPPALRFIETYFLGDKLIMSPGQRRPKNTDLERSETLSASDKPN